jgi:very-short-patch-repair endonuclease
MRRESSEMHVIRLAATQHGVVTTAQLAAAGIGPRAVAHRVAQGWMRRVHHGVYLVGPVEPPLARAMAALLAVGSGAAISHRPAAAIWDFLPPTPGPIHVTVTTRGPRSREGIHVHTTTSLPQSEVRRRHQIPLTSPERTLIDLATTLPERDLERAVEQAQVLRLVTQRSLDRAMERHRGRRGMERLRATLKRETTPALTRSEAERILLDLIREAELPEPLTNTRIGRYEVDMDWPSHRVIVEVDGYTFHSSRAAFERDRRRDADLQAHGYAVIRVTWRQLRSAPHAVVARLAGVLAMRAA